MTDGVDASLNFRYDEKTSPRSERVGRGWFLPFYKANYMGLKTRDRHARQDTPCSRWRFKELPGRGL